MRATGNNGTNHAANVQMIEVIENVSTLQPLTPSTLKLEGSRSPNEAPQVPNLIPTTRQDPSSNADVVDEDEDDLGSTIQMKDEDHEENGLEHMLAASEDGEEEHDIDEHKATGQLQTSGKSTSKASTAATAASAKKSRNKEPRPPPNNPEVPQQSRPPRPPPNNNSVMGQRFLIDDNIVSHKSVDYCLLGSGPKTEEIQRGGSSAGGSFVPA